jgi:linoleoyl-CoA desaturase
MSEILSVAGAPEDATAPGQEVPRQGAAQGPGARPKFDHDGGFQAEVRRRVEEFFRATGRRERDCPQMYLKTAVILAWLASSYALLVFVAAAWWQALPLAVLLGLAMAAVAFNIQHDGNHHGYSRHAWVNNLMAMSLDLVGASSYFWHWKHDVIHHTYANITGQDTDIDTDGLARLSPHQKRRKVHRWQHYYMWLLYGLMTVRWQLFGDFRDLVAGKVVDQKVPRPRGWDLVVLLGGKAVFVSLVFVVPMLLHPAWVVLLFYGAASMVVGVVMAIVFQLAHCVEQADFPLPQQDTGRMEKPWAVHQVETTVDFGRRNPLLTWFLGGLNFQIEHHLFPRVCHVNYPAITGLVEQTCREFGVRYAEHESLRSGLVAHFRWLRQMGSTG